MIVADLIVIVKNVLFRKENIRVSSEAYQKLNEYNPKIDWAYDDCIVQSNVINLFRSLLIVLLAHEDYTDVAKNLIVDYINTKKSKIVINISLIEFGLLKKDQSQDICDIYGPQKLQKLFQCDHLIVVLDNLEELFLKDPNEILKQVFSLAFITNEIFVSNGNYEMDTLRGQVREKLVNFEEKIKA